MMMIDLRSNTHGCELTKLKILQYILTYFRKQKDCA